MTAMEEAMFRQQRRADEAERRLGLVRAIADELKERARTAGSELERARAVLIAERIRAAAGGAA